MLPMFLSMRIEALISIIVAVTFVALWYNGRRLHAQLGGAVHDLTEHIVRLGLGQGDSSSPLQAGPSGRIPAMESLAMAQDYLHKMDVRHKDAEARSVRLTQLYAALSDCNNAIVRCTNERELFSRVCQIIVLQGGMHMAWIGAVDEDTQWIRPIASYGTGLAYLDGLQASADPNQISGFGLTGTAFRENRPIWCQDFQNDPMTAPWHDRAALYSLGSGAALPLQRASGHNMVITIYAKTIKAIFAQNPEKVKISRC